jgi:hypothetical protein
LPGGRGGAPRQFHPPDRIQREPSRRRISGRSAGFWSGCSGAGLASRPGLQPICPWVVSPGKEPSVHPAPWKMEDEFEIAQLSGVDPPPLGGQQGGPQLLVTSRRADPLQRLKTPVGKHSPGKKFLVCGPGDGCCIAVPKEALNLRGEEYGRVQLGSDHFRNHLSIISWTNRLGWNPRGYGRSPRGATPRDDDFLMPPSSEIVMPSFSLSLPAPRSLVPDPLSP